MTTSRRLGAILRWTTVPAALFLVYEALEMPLAGPVLMCGGFTLIAGATAVLILGLLGAAPRPFRQLLESPALVAVGRISYGLYLWHFPVIVELQRHAFFGAKSTALRMVLLLGLAFGLTLLSYYGIERPLVRLKPARLRPAAVPDEPVRAAA